jgi:carboxylesterase
LANSLHETGYTVAAPLLPGHGTTPQDCNRYTWKDWQASVEAIYHQLSENCQRVVIGGESVGALLTLQLATQHPETCAILCYAPALKLKISPIKIMLLSFLAPFVVSFPKPPSMDDNPWKGYAVQPLKAARQMRRLQRVIEPNLVKISQPILILQGSLDPTVHPDSPQIIFNRVSSTIKELHWLENSTHCVILDKERDLAASLTIDFLSRVLA